MDGEYFLAAFFSFFRVGQIAMKLFFLDFISQFHIVFDVILNFLKDPVTVSKVTPTPSLLRSTLSGGILLSFLTRHKKGVTT